MSASTTITPDSKRWATAYQLAKKSWSILLPLALINQLTGILLNILDIFVKPTVTKEVLSKKIVLISHAHLDWSLLDPVIGIIITTFIAMLYWSLFHKIANEQTPDWATSFKQVSAKYLPVIIVTLLLFLAAIVLYFISVFFCGFILALIWHVFNSTPFPAVGAEMIAWGCLSFTFMLFGILPTLFFQQIMLFEKRELSTAIKRAYQLVITVRHWGLFILFLMLPAAILYLAMAIVSGDGTSTITLTPLEALGYSLLQVAGLIILGFLDIYVNALFYQLLDDLRTAKNN